MCSCWLSLGVLGSMFITLLVLCISIELNWLSVVCVYISVWADVRSSVKCKSLSEQHAEKKSSCVWNAAKSYHLFGTYVAIKLVSTTSLFTCTSTMFSVHLYEYDVFCSPVRVRCYGSPVCYDEYDANNVHCTSLLYVVVHLQWTEFRRNRALTSFTSLTNRVGWRASRAWWTSFSELHECVRWRRSLSLSCRCLYPARRNAEGWTLALTIKI